MLSSAARSDGPREFTDQSSGKPRADPAGFGQPRRLARNSASLVGTLLAPRLDDLREPAFALRESVHTLLEHLSHPTAMLVVSPQGGKDVPYQLRRLA
jgi:hypothetical protein